MTSWSELESQAIDFCLCIVLIHCGSVIFQQDKGPMQMVGFPCLIKHQFNSLVQEIDNSPKSAFKDNKNMSFPLTGAWLILYPYRPSREPKAQGSRKKGQRFLINKHLNVQVPRVIERLLFPPKSNIHESFLPY